MTEEQARAIGKRVAGRFDGVSPIFPATFFAGIETVVAQEVLAEEVLNKRTRAQDAAERIFIVSDRAANSIAVCPLDSFHYSPFHFTLHDKADRSSIIRNLRDYVAHAIEIQTAIAVREEREACANVADGYDVGPASTVIKGNIAKLIRARREKEFR